MSAVEARERRAGNLQDRSRLEWAIFGEELGDVDGPRSGRKEDASKESGQGAQLARMVGRGASDSHSVWELGGVILRRRVGEAVRHRVVVGAPRKKVFCVLAPDALPKTEGEYFVRAEAAGHGKVRK